MDMCFPTENKYRSETLFVLWPSKLLISLSLLLPNLAMPVNSADLVAPDPGEQAKILDKVKAYAEQYVSGLPDFICDQIVEQSEAAKNGKHRRRGDTLSSKLVYREQREHRTLEMVNGKSVRPGGRRPHAPLVTEGEFGILLSNIVSASSEAKFNWVDWEVVDEVRMAKFQYSIDKEHSTLSLSLSFLAHAVLPYHGTITADPNTGAVWRITNSADDIPPDVRTKSISTQIEYENVAIGASKYLLPVRASVSSITNNGILNNDMRFENYRKFTADSVLITDPANNEQH